jgi:hypothetical protein
MTAEYRIPQTAIGKHLSAPSLVGYVDSQVAGSQQPGAAAA